MSLHVDQILHARSESQKLQGRLKMNGTKSSLRGSNWQTKGQLLSIAQNTLYENKGFNNSGEFDCITCERFEECSADLCRHTLEPVLRGG